MIEHDRNLVLCDTCGEVASSPFPTAAFHLAFEHNSSTGHRALVRTRQAD